MNMIRSVDRISLHDYSCCHREFLKFSFSLTTSGGDRMYRWSLSQERCLAVAPSAPLCGCSLETDTSLNTERGIQHYLFSQHVPAAIRDTKFVHLSHVSCLDNTCLRLWVSLGLPFIFTVCTIHRHLRLSSLMCGTIFTNEAVFSRA